MIAPKTSRRQLAWELTLYCLTRAKRLHQESKADSTSLSRVMAAVANQVDSTAQQIGARIGWNPIDAATQPPTGTRERVLNLSDPRTDHRNLGFEDSCLSGLSKLKTGRRRHVNHSGVGRVEVASVLNSWRNL